MMVALAVGCSKSSNGISPVPVTSRGVSPSPAAVTYLELSTNAPTHVAIDSRHDCTITATALQDSQLFLRVDIKAPGSVKPTHPIKLVLSSGQEFTLQAEGMAAPLRFKAKLKAD